MEKDYFSGNATATWTSGMRVELPPLFCDNMRKHLLNEATICAQARETRGGSYTVILMIAGRCEWARQALRTGRSQSGVV